jgi:Ca2+-binding RTX toxin-like protein
VVGANATVQSGGMLAMGSGDGLEVGGALADAGQMTVGAGATVEVFANPLNVTGTLTVAGTVETAGMTAVTLGSGPDRLILDPGFSFIGPNPLSPPAVQGGGANSTLELAAGANPGTLNALGTEFTNFGIVTVDPGAAWTVEALASALNGVTITGSGGSNTLTLISSGTVNLAGVSGFPTINLATGNNTVTVTDTTLSGGSVTINDGASGNNSISVLGDTAASTGKTLTYVAGGGNDSFTGGFENDVVYGGAGIDHFTGGKGTNVFLFSAANLTASDTVTGGGGTSANYLLMTTPGTVSAGGVSGVQAYGLANGGANSLSLTDGNFAGVSGGSITVFGGNAGNTISAAGDTMASTGKTLIYAAGAGTDTFTGGFENDLVFGGAGTDHFTGGTGTNVFAFSAANLTASDTVTGGSGTNYLVMTSPGPVAAGGVSGVEVYGLANGGANSLSLTDGNFTGIAPGGLIAVFGGNAGNTISAAGDTMANTGKYLIYEAGAGNDTFTGGFENDVVFAGAGADVLTGGDGTNAFYAGGDTRIDFSKLQGINTINDFGTGTNAIAFSSSGFALGLGGTGTPQPLPAGLFVSDPGGTFTAPTQRFAYGTSNGELFYSASGTTATEHLVATLTGDPTLTASQLFFIT